MATITTRVQGDSPKGSPLTNAEVDNNFINLNTAKYESGDNISVGSITASGNVTVQSSGIPTITLFNQDTSVGASQLLSSLVFDNNDDSGNISGNYYIRNYSTDGFAASNLHFYYQRATGGPLLDVFSLRDYGSNSQLGVVINESSQDLDFRVESNTSTHALFIDAGNNVVGLGTASTLDPWTGYTPTALGNMLMIGSTGASSTFTNMVHGGYYDGTNWLQRFTDVTVSRHEMIGGASGSAQKFYTATNVTADTATTQVLNLSLTPTTVVVNQDSRNMDFRVESDTNSNGLFFDASASALGINKQPDANGYYALDIDGVIRQNGTAVSGIVYPYTTTVSRALNAPTEWFKIWQGNASSTVTKLQIQHGGDNTNFRGEFTVNTAGYSFAHNIVLDNYAYYNGPQLKEIFTRTVSNTTTEIWVKVDTLTSYAGSMTVSCNNTGLLGTFTAESTEPSGINTRLRSTHWPGSTNRSSAAFSDAIHLSNASPVRFYRSDDTRHSSIYHDNAGMKIETNFSGDNIYLRNKSGTTGNVFIDNGGDGYSVVVNDISANTDFRVESNGNTHALFVDGQEDAVVVNGSTHKGDFTVWSRDETANHAYFSIKKSDDNGHASGYSANGIEIHSRALTTSGDSHTAFLGFHNANTDTGPNGHGTSAYMTMTTPGSQGTYGRGEFNFYIRNSAPYTFPNNPETNSSYWMNSLFRIQSAGEVAVNPVGSASGDFRVESDGHSNMFLVDANTNRVGIRTATPAADFHVEGSQYTMANISAGHKGRNAAMYGINLASNPEGKFVQHPYLHNDCAHSYDRGNATINGLSGFSGANAPFRPDGGFMSFANSQVNGSDPEGVDSGDYWYYEVVPNKAMSYGRNWFINFGNTGWAPQHVKIREYVSGVWRKVYDSDTSGTNGSETHWSPGYNSAAAPTKVQFICSDDAPSNSQRVNHIGGYNYSSDGMRGYFVGADGSGLFDNLHMPSGKGIDFSFANGAVSNTAENILDDYDEGTWTPTLYGQSTAGTMTQPNSSYQSTPIGYYTKIGRQVYMTAVFRGVALTGASGHLRLGGLPYSFTRVNGVTTYLEGFDPRYNKSLGGSYQTGGIVVRGTGNNAAFGPGHSSQWDVYLDANNTLWNGGGNGVHGTITLLGYV